MADPRPAPEIFGRFCESLNRYGVDYVVIGSEAVAFHGVPRFSLDFNIFVRPTTVNLFHVKAALEAAEITNLDQLDPEVWARNRGLLRVGEPPFQIDICLGISGLTYEQASASAVAGQYGNVAVGFLGRDALIANKKASARPKDLADVDLLISSETKPNES